MPDASRLAAHQEAPRPAPDDRAMRLRLAGVASHLAEAPGLASEAAEASLLGRLCAHVAGPVYRLGPGRYALRLDGDPETAARDLEAELDLGPEGRALPIPEPRAPDPDAALALVGPFALGAGAGRVVIDADFALETARRTADAIAEAAEAQGVGAAGLGRRLDAVDAALDALREGREADAERRSRDDRLDRALAALAAQDRRLERMETRLAALPHADPAPALMALQEAVETGRAESARREGGLADRLDPLADGLRAAETRLAVVTETLGAVAAELARAPDVRRERDGLLMFAANLQSLLAGIDAQADRLRRIADGAAPLADLALDRAAAAAATDRLEAHGAALAALRGDLGGAVERLEGLAETLAAPSAVDRDEDAPQAADEG